MLKGPITFTESSIIIRKARREDIPGVMRVNLESLPENYWHGFYLYILENWGDLFFVAEHNGEIVGYAMSRVEETRDPVLLGLASELELGLRGKISTWIQSILSEPRKTGHLISIAVLAPYRRRGIGSSLLRATIEAAREIYDVDSIYLEVRVSNMPAIKLYEKFGFRKVRRIKSYYRDGEDAYVMVKRLKE